MNRAKLVKTEVLDKMDVFCHTPAPFHDSQQALSFLGACCRQPPSNELLTLAVLIPAARLVTCDDRVPKELGVVHSLAGRSGKPDPGLPTHDEATPLAVGAADHRECERAMGVVLMVSHVSAQSFSGRCGAPAAGGSLGDTIGY